MIQVPGQHEKIHFLRRDAQDLNLFPSTCSSDGVKVSMLRLFKTPRWLRRTVLAVFLFVFILFASAVLILKVGIRGEMLTGKMQEILTEKLGDLAVAKMRDVRLSLDEHFRIALEARDVDVQQIQGGIKLNHIASVRVSLSTSGLLQGKIQVVGGGVSGAEITLLQNAPNAAQSLKPQGFMVQADPEAAGNMVFTSLDRILSLLDQQKTHKLKLEDIVLNAPIGGKIRQLSIKRLDMDNTGSSMKITASLGWQGQAIDLSGLVLRDTQGRAQKFSLTAHNIPFHLGAADDVSPYYADGRTNNRHFRLKGIVAAMAEGTRTEGETPGNLSLSVALTGGQTDIAAYQDINTRLSGKLRYVSGSGALEIDALHLTLGGLDIPLHGTVQTQTEAGENAGRYPFTLSADNAISAPETSPAQPMRFSAELVGMLQPAAKQITVDKLRLQSSANEHITGMGKIRFADGSPETSLILKAPSLTVESVKQLWPLNITPDTRNWVLSHIFGGHLTEASLELALPGGFFVPGQPPKALTEKELKINAKLENVRTDLVGELPPLHETYGRLNLKGTKTTVDVERASAHAGGGEPLHISQGKVVIPWIPGEQTIADISVNIAGKAAAIGRLADYKPVNIAQKIPFDMQDTSGAIDIALKLKTPIGRNINADEIDWDARLAFKNFSLHKPFQGNTKIRDANGTVHATRQDIALSGNALLNDYPAHMEMLWPTQGQDVAKPTQEKLTFYLDSAMQKKLVPGLDMLLNGDIAVDVGPEQNGQRHIVADLSKANLDIPWIGWKKGNGIAATAEMTVPVDATTLRDIDIKDFQLKGASFHIAGQFSIRNHSFASANFSKVMLNRNDNAQLTIQKNGNNLQIRLAGSQFDARALIKQLTDSRATGGGRAAMANGLTGGEVTVNSDLKRITGFYGETLSDFKATYKLGRAGNSTLSLNGLAQGQYRISVQFDNAQGVQSLAVTALDAGALLRFMNLYDKVYGGRLESTMQSTKETPLSGPVSLHNFQIVNEPKLASLVSSSPAGGGRSLNDAVNGKIDASRVVIDRAYGHIAKGENFLVLDQGVIRGPSVGATFQGIVYDAAGNIAMTGTFMPGYGLNSLFSNLPIIGAVLGNGRDRGLIGITFKVEGSAKAPRVVVNPISVIAPGVFRSIFEFK